MVDGNVFRVLARYYGISTPINTVQGKHEFTALAQALLPADQASLFNQAMMDFGAVQCTPASPRCALCPLQEGCTALREGSIGQLPVKLRKLKVKELRLQYIYIRYAKQTALRRRPAGDIWQGLYEPLTMQAVISQPPTSELLLLRSNVKHVLTHRILYADFYLWQPKERPLLPDGYFWVSEADLDQYAVPRLVELLFEALP